MYVQNARASLYVLSCSNQSHKPSMPGVTSPTTSAAGGSAQQQNMALTRRWTRWRKKFTRSLPKRKKPKRQECPSPNGKNVALEVKSKCVTLVQLQLRVHLKYGGGSTEREDPRLIMMKTDRTLSTENIARFLGPQMVTT